MNRLSAYFAGVRHPEAYHGTFRNQGFFEGWYVKLVSADQTQRWAVIPGIFKGVETAGDYQANQAFVQVLDGMTGRSWFHEFEASTFRAATDRFAVSVGENHFDSAGATLNLPELSGRINYTTELDPWPVTWRSPGIMGWFGLVPFMECFHGIVSFGHQISGELLVEGSSVDFAGGRGYIEKDWGKAFPAGYVWMQSNHFAKNPDASLIASVAIIPWLGGAFRGYIVGLKHGGRLHKWTTYNRTDEKKLTLDDSHITWVLNGPDGVLEISAERQAGGLLHAPPRTAIHQRVEETMLAKISVRHLSRTGVVLFEDTGYTAAMEVFGDLPRLLAIRQ